MILRTAVVLLVAGLCLAVLVTAKHSTKADTRGSVCKPKGNRNETDNYDLLFSTGSKSDYVIAHDLPRDLSAFTLSLWMMTTDRTSSDRSLFSFATSSYHNEIILYRMGGLAVVIQDEIKETQAKLNDGKWHHVIFQWENKKGSYKLYVDGVLQASGSDYKKGKVIPKTGAIVLGQDQDSVGGDFDANQAYIGLLTKVDLWDKILSENSLTYLKKCDSGLHGNVLRWNESWIAGIRGDVKVLRPSICNAEHK